ncbi:MAG: DUF429 domain-containing protein [Gammaproteobacteria bacterium]|nr:DUF429 domain-containing protein [Gammaproteobacteria bacterium]MDE0270077.1 DUF429 domain-containing protein [Gammaproteobacteria bacterium]
MYGVDGCKAGWFYVAFESSGNARWGIVKKIESLVHQAAEPDRIFIDVPIGLPCGHEGRVCDREARGKLGFPRRCSVFPAPARAVLEAESYCEAKGVSQEVTGKKVSRQTFAILPKIKEVDCLLRASAKARRIVREVHPEVCFWALAGCKPMGQSKKGKLGLDQRLEVLSQHWGAANETYQEILDAHPRRELARDDILDAAVAAITALADESSLKTLPAEPPQDDRGLPMEMVYVPSEAVRLGG